jgi:hypothetical protein
MQDGTSAAGPVRAVYALLLLHGPIAYHFELRYRFSLASLQRRVHSGGLCCICVMSIVKPDWR